MNQFDQNKFEVLKYLSEKTGRVGMLPLEMVRTARALLHEKKFVKADPEMGWNLTVQGRDELERLNQQFHLELQRGW